MDSTPVCPYCNAVVTLLPLVSSVSVTDLYRCDNCGKVSEASKGTNVPRALETRPEPVAKPVEEVISKPTEAVWSEFTVSTSSAFDRQYFFAGWRRAL